MSYRRRKSSRHFKNNTVLQLTLGLLSQLLSVAFELYLSNAAHSREIHRLLPRKEFCRVGLLCANGRLVIRKAACARALEVHVHTLRVHCPGAAPWRTCSGASS
jgi:hypothetical protein